MSEWTYCIVLYTKSVNCCIVLYCTCTVLYSTVLYCTVLCYTFMYCVVLCYTFMYCTVMYCTVLCYALPLFIAMKHIVSHFKWMYRYLWNISIFLVASLTLLKMNDRKWITLLIIFASVLVSFPKIIFFSHTYLWLIFIFNRRQQHSTSKSSFPTRK